MKKKVAVLGANGFLGSRVVEIFHLSGVCEVFPVVRQVASLARLSRFNLPWHLADSRVHDELARAVAGCEIVIDCTVGNPADIESAAQVLTSAVHQAGGRRIIYLSTASVHGQNPTPGANESSRLSDRQEMPYNNAKVRAERILFADAKRLGIELFVLRPSIVYGPRDRWISTLVEELEEGSAWLVDGGQGICNNIYVDNVVEAIRCCLEASEHAAGSAYLIGDEEAVTWRKLYESTARSLDVNFESVNQMPLPHVPVRTLSSRLNAVRVLPAVQWLIAVFPSRLKSIIKGAVSGFFPQVTANPWKLQDGKVAPRPSHEMVLLQQCRYRFPQTQAAKKLGYKPVVSFEEGLRRTLAWIKWAKS